MTESEQDRILGSVIREHKEARILLASLRCKAKEIAQTLEMFIDFLMEKREGSHQAGSDFPLATSKGEGGVCIERRNIRYPDPENIAVIVSEINETKEIIGELEIRKRNLGY